MNGEREEEEEALKCEYTKEDSQETVCETDQICKYAVGLSFLAMGREGIKYKKKFPACRHEDNFSPLDVCTV